MRQLSFKRHRFQADIIRHSNWLYARFTLSFRDVQKDRSDIGTVEFPIEKLLEFRDASASCVHIEAAMEADRGLTDTGKKRPK